MIFLSSAQVKTRYSERQRCLWGGETQVPGTFAPFGAQRVRAGSRFYRNVGCQPAPVPVDCRVLDEFPGVNLTDQSQRAPIDWVTTALFSTTFAVAIVAVPIYGALIGYSAESWAWFVVFLLASGVSITAGY